MNDDPVIISARPTSAICRNCNAFNPTTGGLGECRRNPPEIEDGWPLTREVDWCLFYNNDWEDVG